MDYKTNKQKQQEYGKVKTIISNMLNGYTNQYSERIPASIDVLNYIKWNKLTKEQQDTIYSIWDKYYGEVRNSRAYFNFKEMSEAFKMGDVARAREISLEAKQLRNDIEVGKPEVELPKVFNPYGVSNRADVHIYTTALWKKRTMDEESKNIESGDSLSGVFLEKNIELDETVQDMFGR